MDKNTFVAIILIFFVLMLFQLLYFKPWIERPVQEEPRESVEEQPKDQTPVPEPTQEGVVEAESPEYVSTDSLKEPQVRTLSVETDNFLIKITTLGAGIESLKLKKYMNRDGTPIELIERNEGDILPFEVRFDRLRNLSDHRSKTVFHVEKLAEYTYTFFKDFKGKNGNRFRVSKTYIFQQDEYVFDIRIKVQALDESEIYLNQDNVSYTLLWGPMLGPKSVIRNRYNITTQGYHENKKFRKVMRGAGGCSIRRDESKYMEIARILDWIGVTNRYFFVSIVPDTKDYIFAFDQRVQGSYLIGISHSYFRGIEFEDTFSVYTGPKDRRILKRYGNDYESVMGSRILKPIVIFLELMIDAFYRFTKNYGIAIILMTIVIKIILYPLTHKSFTSMRRMSALQPKMTEIREKYKSNPQQMNRELSGLYKKEKVNPMGGCLPIVLQLPIFYALYTLLSGMIELRHESFLWINDLSLPDTVATIKIAIPLLGYRIGAQGYTDINILPFIMTATTLLQSKLTSGGSANQQGKMMTYLFPLMFFFIFWNMPSGLVLYWTIQNILTIGQQYIINYRLKLKEGNLKKTQTNKR